MFKKPLTSSILVACTLLLMGGTRIIAQTPAQPAAQPTAQPTAPTAKPTTPAAKPGTGMRSNYQVVQQLCKFLQAQKRFTVDMDIYYDEVLTTGEKVQYSAYQRLWVEKPNRLRSQYVGDQRVTNLYYDGKSVTLQAPNLNYYATKNAPSTLDATLNQFEEKYGITIPMSNLVTSDTCADMDADVQQAKFVGVDMVARQPMYHILLTGIERDYQIWVTRNEQPLLRKAIITYKDLPGSPQYTVYFSNWNFKPRIPANTFTFTPSKDEIKIEFLAPSGDALMQKVGN